MWREGVRRELEEARAAVEAKYTALLQLQVMKMNLESDRKIGRSAGNENDDSDG